jgi:hypothetical protein
MMQSTTLTAAVPHAAAVILITRETDPGRA